MNHDRAGDRGTSRVSPSNDRAAPRAGATAVAGPPLRLRQVPHVSTKVPPNEAIHYEYEISNDGPTRFKGVVFQAMPSGGLYAV